MSVVLQTAGWGTIEQRRRLVDRLTFTIQPDPKYAAQKVEVYTILKDKRSFVCPFAVGQLDEYKTMQVHGSVASTWSTQPAATQKRKPKPRHAVLPSPVFHGALFSNQVCIHEEAWTHLMQQKNVLMHLSTGIGKCLAPGTPVLLWNGTTKRAGDVVVGDQLIGDDGLPRSVLSTCTGEDDLYTVEQDDGESYTVNSAHILCVASKSGEVMDLNVLECATMNVFGCKSRMVRWPSQPVPLDPWAVGVWLAGVYSDVEGVDGVLRDSMLRYLERTLDEQWTEAPLTHRHIPRCYLINDASVRLKLLAGLIDGSGHRLSGHRLSGHRLSGHRLVALAHPHSTQLATDIVYLARSLGLHCAVSNDQHTGWQCRFSMPKLIHRNNRLHIQPAGRGAYAGFTLDGNGRFLLSDFTVTHNTSMAVHLAYRLYTELHPSGPQQPISPTQPAPDPPIPTQLTTIPPTAAEMQSNHTDPFVVMVIIHRAEIQRQWVETIEERLRGSCSVQVLNRKCAIEPTPYPIKFVIINTVNVDHRWSPEHPFHCSLLLLDEAHTCVTDNAIFRLLSVRPQYLVALTATPDRSDGRSAALNMVASPRVVRKMRRLFHVYHYQTPWRCRVTTNASTGELDWNVILEAQATQPRRNRLIAELVLLFWRAERTIMVLCKRVEQVQLIQRALADVRGTFVASETLVGGSGLVSNQLPLLPRPRVLIATYSIAGVGFSDSRLDTLIVAADVEEMALQYAGRIFRRPDVSPIIVDVVDPHVPGMKKHFRSRCEVYTGMGGVVERFEDAHDCSLLPIDLVW